jgi:hypothetical protein
MKEDYLWDRSGEPDPELQELEEILGTLRYQPRPLHIPAQIQVRRGGFVGALAIAAAIALFAVFLGVWFHFNRLRSAPPLEAKRSSQTEQKPTEARQATSANEGSQTPSPSTTRNNRKADRSPTRNLIAGGKTPFIRREIRRESRPPQLTPQELAEKEQVLIALRLVSAKLNLAQRKAQGAPQLNNIRNQRKIG